MFVFRLFLPFAITFSLVVDVTGNDDEDDVGNNEDDEFEEGNKPPNFSNIFINSYGSIEYPLE